MRRLWVFRTSKVNEYKGDPRSSCYNNISVKRVRDVIAAFDPINIDFSPSENWINDELYHGRLRQGWGTPGLDVRLPEKEWIENFLIACYIYWEEDFGDSKCPDAMGRKKILDRMLNINIGDIVFVPKTPDADHFIVGTVSRTYYFDCAPYPTDDFRTDFRHIIELENLGYSPNSVFQVPGIFGAPFRHAIDPIDPSYQTYEIFEDFVDNQYEIAIREYNKV